MIPGPLFAEELVRRGNDIAISVPCSVLRPLIDAVADSQELIHIPATSEAEAVGIAAGAWLAGKSPVLLMQNSGFFESLNAIASLLVPMRAPIPFLVSGRGSFGIDDEQHHDLAGRSFLAVAELVGLPTAVLNSPKADLRSLLEGLTEKSERLGKPSILAIPANVLNNEGPSDVCHPYHEQLDNFVDETEFDQECPISTGQMMSRREALASIVAGLPKDGAVVAGVGFVGRELFSTGDRDTYLYLSGAMGCASAVGLGLSIFTSRSVAVLDGDGAALMRLGNLVTIGSVQPQNFAHVLFNNGQYESTGGQRTVGGRVQFSMFARACGYPYSARFWDAKELGRTIRHMTNDEVRTPLFAEVMIDGGATDLPRPSIPLADQAQRFRRVVAGTGMRSPAAS